MMHFNPMTSAVASLKELSKVYRSVQGVIAIGKTTMATNESTSVSTCQVEHHPKLQTHSYNHFQHFGFASALPAHTDTVRVAVNGNPAIGNVIASNNNQFRPIGMMTGETQIYDNAKQSIYLQNGMKIVATANNECDIYIGTKLVMQITASGVVVTGSLTTSGNVTVGTGATGSFSTQTGNIVTVQDGIITNIF